MSETSPHPFRVFLVNPAPSAERIKFSFITPRFLPVLAAVTPEADFIKGLRLIDQAVEPFPIDEVQPGDLVGIGIHTFNALHGYNLAKRVHELGATTIIGGPHVSVFPDEAAKHGDAVVTGDAELVWGQALRDYAEGRLQPRYNGGRVDPEFFSPARWDLMTLDRYLVASVQTVRGCPKSCSFCSVWVQDGRSPRLRTNDAIITELKALYNSGFRLIMFADDNFYPYTPQDIENAPNEEQRGRLEKGMQARYELLERLADEIPSDMFFFTQITMEVADDPKYMKAMKKGRIGGALIGIETITEEGLKATNKGFNSSGAELARRLETIRKEAFSYIMGAFIFGIETDTQESMDQTIDFARDCGVALVQFIPLTPLPGTVDFQMMRKDRKVLKLKDVNYDYWLDPDHPRILYHHPHLKEEEILDGIERAWRDFYGMASTLKRCRRFGMFKDLRNFVAYFVVCQGMLSRYRRYGISADSAVRGTKHKIANILGKMALSLLKRPPQPPLGALGTNGSSPTLEAAERAASLEKDSPAMQPTAVDRDRTGVPQEQPQTSESSIVS